MESRCYCCRSHYYSQRTFQLALSPSSGSDGFVELFLVLETNFYAKQQFKAYKSVEAYNFMVSGFIASVQGCVVHEKYIVTGKMKQSQRMNDPLILIWVIGDKDGTVNSAHCLGSMQSRDGGVMLPRSQRVVLYRNLDKNIC